MDKEPDSGALIALPAAEFEALLERAAETGARRALHEVGLDGQDAAEDIRDLRSLLAGFRLAKQTAVQTAVRLITTGVLLALMAGFAIKLKLFGPTPQPIRPTHQTTARPRRRAGFFCAWRPAMTTMTYKHWRDVPERSWRWPSFSPAEIACRGTGKLLVNDPALDKLQALRDRLGKPLIVRSAYRSPVHNRAVG